MSVRAAVAALPAVVLVAGCGGVQSPDLFAVSRSGTVPGARLGLVVSDGGTVRCDGSPPRRLPDDLLLSAREVARELKDDAVRGLDLPPRAGSVLLYRLRDADGHLAFPDTAAGSRPELARLTLFVRRAAQQVCGLAR